jgi:uncharacterized membrane protein YkvA (DUF1232 family)
MLRMTDKTPPGFDLDRMADDERIVKRGFWGKLRRTAGRVPFAREAVAAYCCATDPATPMRVKAIILAALAYFVVPTDLIPDVILGLGFTDDIAVFWAAWRAVSGHITDAHFERARKLLAQSGETHSDS